MVRHCSDQLSCMHTGRLTISSSTNLARAICECLEQRWTSCKLLLSPLLCPSVLSFYSGFFLLVHGLLGTSLSLALSLLNLAASHKDSHHGGEEARWLGHHLAMPQPAKSSSWIHKLYIYYRICIRYSVNEICILSYFVFLVWTGDIYCMSVYPGRGIFPLCTLNKLTEQAECSLELQMLYII